MSEFCLYGGFPGIENKESLRDWICKERTHYRDDVRDNVKWNSILSVLSILEAHNQFNDNLEAVYDDDTIIDKVALHLVSEQKRAGSILLILSIIGFILQVISYFQSRRDAKQFTKRVRARMKELSPGQELQSSISGS